MKILAVFLMQILSSFVRHAYINDNLEPGHSIGWPMIFHWSLMACNNLTFR